MELNAVILGEKIKQARTVKGLSQFQLAEMVGVHEKQISRIEKGINMPSFDTALKIIHSLNIDTALLAKDSINNYNPLRDDIMALLSDAIDEELLLYRDLIKAARSNFRMSYSERQILKDEIINHKKELTERTALNDARKAKRRKNA